MRTVGRLGVVLGVVVFIAAASPVLAQQGGGKGKGQGGGGRGPQGPANLVATNEVVQKELKVEPDQLEKVKKIAADAQEKMRSEFAALRDLSPEEAREKGRELGKKMNDDQMKALAEVLKPEQIDRLKQLQLQQRAAMGQAFADPEVHKGLKLTDEQKEKIKTINEDAQKEIQALGRGPDTNDKRATIRKETMEKIMAVLNDEQKAAWGAMTGKHVDMPTGLRPARPKTEADKGPPPGK